jgi:hypothetical protein
MHGPMLKAASPQCLTTEGLYPYIFLLKVFSNDG